MAIKLKAVLAEHGISLAELARSIDISRPTLSGICNHGQWPKSPAKDVLVVRIMDELIARLGHEDWDADGLFEEVADERCNARQPVDIAPVKTGAISEEDFMLLRKQGLTPAAKKHFGLFRDPFSNDVESAEDVFISPDIRYVREAMFQTAKHGGFMAVVGESGAGKSTLIEDVEERLMETDKRVLLFKPFVVGMEGDDINGKRLKAASILDSILRRLKPGKSMRSQTLEDKGNAAKDALIESYQAGYRHCLIIEEAHRLAVPTLKHLKGFYEMKIGRTPLLSILLIGQPEIRKHLTPSNYDLREVVQRCEIVELLPLDSKLEEYVAFKFKRVGKELSEVFEPNALDAVRTRLIDHGTAIKDGKRHTYSFSILYPLAVNNLISGALNLAAELGAPKVNADLVKEV
jgi:type II secretory pathway predicted ATPase ExeA